MRDPFQWSIGLGRWHGLTLHLHVLFVVFALIAAYVFWPSDLTGTARQVEHPLMAAGNLVGMAAATISALFLSVLLHELAHWWVARWARVEPRAIVLGPLGGLTEWPSTAGPRWELAIWLAGLAANLLLTILLLAVMRWAHPEIPLLSLISPLEPVHVEQPAAFVLSIAIWLNCLLILLNLLPSYPFDGARILRAALQVAFPHWGQRRLAECNFWLTITLSAIIAAVGLVLWKHGTASDSLSRAWLALLLLAVVLLVNARREALAPATTASEPDRGQTSAAPRSRTAGQGRNQPPFSSRKDGLWTRNHDADNDQNGYPDDDRHDASRADEYWADEDESDEFDEEPAANKARPSEVDEVLEEQRVDAILSQLYAHGMESLSAEDRALLQRASARYRSRLGRRNGLGRHH